MRDSPSDFHLLYLKYEGIGRYLWICPKKDRQTRFKNCLQGKVLIIENGEEFSRIYKKFHEKFEWVQDQPWKENEAPFIKIKPFSKSSWGLE